MNRKLMERAGKMFVFRFYASVNSLIDGKMFVLNQEYCSHVLYKKNPEVSSYDDLSYYTYIDNICFLYGANKKIKKFYGCYFSIDKMSSNELEKMEQFLNSKNLRPRSLLF